MIKRANASYIYQPDKYTEIYDSFLGQNIWEYLNSEDGLTLLKQASEVGQSAEGAVNDILFSKFGNEMNKYEVHEAITHMTTFIMRELGYRMVQRTFGTYKNCNVPFSFCRYKKSTRSKILGTIGVGGSFIIEDFLKKKDTNNAIFDAFPENGKWVVEITGQAVFEDLNNISDSIKRPENFDFDKENCFTILSDLSISEIYLRIKNYYDKVINFNGSKIVNLPFEPTNNQMLDLVEQINTRGFLFYARKEKDIYGVRLEQYATALKKKL